MTVDNKNYFRSCCVLDGVYWIGRGTNDTAIVNKVDVDLNTPTFASLVCPTEALGTDKPIGLFQMMGLVVDAVAQGAHLIVSVLDATGVAEEYVRIQYIRFPSFTPLTSLGDTTMFAMRFEV